MFPMSPTKKLLNLADNITLLSPSRMCQCVNGKLAFFSCSLFLPILKSFIVFDHVDDTSTAPSSMIQDEFGKLIPNNEFSLQQQTDILDSCSLLYPRHHFIQYSLLHHYETPHFLPKMHGLQWKYDSTTKPSPDFCLSNMIVVVSTKGDI